MPYTEQALAVYYKQTSVEERESGCNSRGMCKQNIAYVSYISITWCTGSFNVQLTPSWLFENLAFPPLRCQESSEVANENTLNLCRTFDDPRRTVNPRALPKQCMHPPLTLLELPQLSRWEDSGLDSEGENVSLRNQWQDRWKQLLD